MTTSRTPWHFELGQSGSGGIVYDLDHRPIGWFPDANNAQHVIDQAEKIVKLEEQIHELEIENEELECNVKNIDENLNETKPN